MTASPYDPEDDFKTPSDFRTHASGEKRILGPNASDVSLDDNFGRVVHFGAGVLTGFVFLLASARQGQNSPRHLHK